MNQVVNKNELGSAGNERRDGDELVHSENRLEVVIHELRIGTDVAHDPEVMEGHKDTIGADETQPEMDLAPGFVHHPSRHLGEPEIGSGEDPEDGRHGHYQVEVAHHEVGRVEHDVDRGLSQEKAAYAAAD